MRTMAGYTLFYYKNNLYIMKIKYTTSYELTDITGNPMFFECPAQEYHSKLSVTNQKDEDL
jgi:hypothetical protein